MSDEYQLRKDIDRIYADLYQIDDNSVNVLTFRDRSKLKYLGNSDEIATIDDIFDYYQLYDRGSGGGDSGDLSDYVKKSDVDLKFDLEDNGTITIGIDVGDGF